MELNTSHKALGLYVLGAIAALGASIGNLDPAYKLPEGPLPVWMAEQRGQRLDAPISPGLAAVKVVLALGSLGALTGAMMLCKQGVVEEHAAWQQETLRDYARHLDVEARRIEIEADAQNNLEAYAPISEELALHQGRARLAASLGIPLEALQPMPEPMPEPMAEPMSEAAIAPPRQPRAEGDRTLEVSAVAVGSEPLPEPMPEAAIAPSTDPKEFADIAQILASYDGHLMIASRTGAGKTSTLLAAMEAMLSIYGGKAILRIVDPKQSGWAGLEADEKAVRYPDLADPEGAAFDLLEALQEATAELSRRSKARRKARSEGKKWSPPPYYLILDEQVSLLSLAGQYDMQGNEGPKILPQVKAALNSILLMGREDRVRLWVCGQSHLCQDAGFNSSVRDSFGVIAQGRDGDFRSIERAIGDQYLIPSKAERDRLQAELSELKAIAGERPIIFSAIKGYRLGLLPDLEGIKDRRFLEPQKQDTSPEQAIAKLEAELAAIRAQMGGKNKA